MHSTSLIADLLRVAWVVALLISAGGLVVVVAASRRNRGDTDPVFDALIKERQAEMRAARRRLHQRQRP